MKYDVIFLGGFFVFVGALAYFVPNLWLLAPRRDIAAFGSLKEKEAEAKRIQEWSKDEKWREARRSATRKRGVQLMGVGLVLACLGLLL